MFARLAPLEARLAEIEGGVGRLAPLAEDDPRAALDGLRARLEALHWAQGETAAGLAALRAAAGERDGEGGALAEIADRLTRLFAQKDAGLAATPRPAAPLEARLAALEARPWDPEAEAARAEAQAVAAQLIAAARRRRRPRSSPTGSPRSRRACRGDAAPRRAPGGGRRRPSSRRSGAAARRLAAPDVTADAAGGRPVTPA